MVLNQRRPKYHRGQKEGFFVSYYGFAVPFLVRVLYHMDLNDILKSRASLDMDETLNFESYS